MLALIAWSVAAAPPARAQSSTMSIHVGLPGFYTPVLLDSVAVAFTIDGSRARVFAAARATLGDLGIPLTRIDSLRGTLVNVNLDARRRLSGKRLSELLSCGTGLIGENADRFRVTIAVAAFVDSLAPEQSRLRVAFAAGARDTEGSSKPPVTCGSTGAFENMLGERVARRLGTRL
jgi:hypothetical protein